VVSVAHAADPAQELASAVVKELACGEAYYAPRCLCLLSRAHWPLAFKACLLSLQQMATRSLVAPLPLPVETCLTHLVLNVPMPVSGGPIVRFEIGNGAPPLHISCALPDALPSTEYSVAMLLRRLSANTLLAIFSCLLLERQVVIVSDDDEVRLATCELLLLLMHPLQWVQVYVPTIPDDLLTLLQNPFPCLLGLRCEQKDHLPSPLPAEMALLDLDSGELVGPEARLPPFPPREEIQLVDALNAVRLALEPRLTPATAAPFGLPAASSPQQTSDPEALGVSLDAGTLDAVVAATPHLSDTLGLTILSRPKQDAAAMQAEATVDARIRGAFLRCLISLLRDLHRFVPEETARTTTPEASARASEPDAAGLPAQVHGAAAPVAFSDTGCLDDQLADFMSAQPSTSRPFLAELTRTQLFLCFIEPIEPAQVSGMKEAKTTLPGGRGGRCFQLVRDAFLARELRRAADREREHGSTPLPVSVALLEIDAKLTSIRHGDATSAAALAPGAPAVCAAADLDSSRAGATATVDLDSSRATAPATVNPATLSMSVLAPRPICEIAPPRLRGVVTPAADPMVCAEGAVPLALPEALWAAHVPVNAFEGQPAPPTRLSPAVRAAWAEALAELEERNAKRVGAQVAAGVGGGLLIGGAVAAASLGCCLQ